MGELGTNTIDEETGVNDTKHVKGEHHFGFETDEHLATATRNSIATHIDAKDTKVNGCNFETNSQQPVHNDHNKKQNVELEGKTDHDSRQSKWSHFRNPSNRKKIIKTAFLLWDFIALGWLYGQMGPTLPDLRLITNAPLDEATWLFAGFSIGYLIGCLVSGMIEKRISQEGLIGLCCSMCAFAVTVLPWIPNLVAMVVIRLVIGFCYGGIDAGGHSLVFKIWGSDGGPFVQMFHAVFALGGVLSPLVSKPFMIEVVDDGNLNTTYCSALTTSNILNTTNQRIDYLNTTETTNTCITLTDTNVQYAYLITGCIMFSAAVPFLVLFTQTCRTADKSDVVPETVIEDMNSKMTSNLKVLVMCILMVISYLATALLDLFPNLLTTFMMSKLQWTQKSSSTLTSMYFAAYGIGNFINIFTLLIITSTKLIITLYVSGIAVLSLFVYSVVTDQTTLIWVTVTAFGLTLSSILPTRFTWTQSNVTPITTRISSCFLVSGSIGIMVNPILMGYLMDDVSPMWFVYISCGEAVLCFLLFSLALCLLKLCAKKEAVDKGITITRF